MTYNFDPDQWYENHLSVLEARHRRGELDDRAFEAAVAKLDADYDALVDRLDGTYQLPDEEKNRSCPHRK